MSSKSIGWRQYWEGETSVYVNRRHKLAHYSALAGEVAALVRRGDAHVLDYGSGEALAAGTIAARCGKLYLLDAAPRVRDTLIGRFGQTRQVVVLSPEEIERIPDHSLDLVILNSLLQYLLAAERDAVLAVIRRKLRGTGELLVADVIPRGLGPIQDASELLRFAARDGFLIGAVTGLVRTCFSSYRKTRAELGLAQYDRDEMIAILARAGFSATPAPRNLGHNQHRLAFLARPAAAPADAPLLAAAE